MNPLICSSQQLYEVSCHNHHFVNEETEASRGQVTGPGSAAELDFEPKQPHSRVQKESGPGQVPVVHTCNPRIMVLGKGE
jgi:hypothetical protein